MRLLRESPAKGALGHLHASDLRALVQLAAQATSGVSRVVEGVHQSVWSTLGAPGGDEPGQARGVTGGVYRGIQGITKLVGRVTDELLEKLEPLLSGMQRGEIERPQREVVLAALNGVMGDRLVESGNSFAVPMSLRYRGAALDWQAMPPVSSVSSKVLLLVHGLCSSDRHWRREHEGREVDHGQALASAMGATPLYLRYNTGLHISVNGRELAAQLEQLVRTWPVPLEELTVVSHSMGGLVTRSAAHIGHQEGQSWFGRLKSLVFLGTPHHGAPLERIGSWLDEVLGSLAYTAPFSRLSQLRSAGITDLRFGHVVDEDWQGRDRFLRHSDRRQPVPLPSGVASYAIAASLASQDARPIQSALAECFVGDGLVPLHSALGTSALGASALGTSALGTSALRGPDEAERRLQFPKEAQWIAKGMNHLELLSRPEVTRQLLRWLAPESGQSLVSDESGEVGPSLH